MMEPTNEAAPGERLSWSKVWISVLTQPSTETFEWILRDPQASARRAYLWVFLSAIIGSILSGLISMLGFNAFGGFDEVSGFRLRFILLICSPVFGALAVLGVAINAGISQWVAGRFFGGIGTYEKLVYAIAAFYAPIYLVSSMIGGIPIIQCLGILIGIYALVLGVMAVKAVNEFDWGPALVSYLAVPVLVAMVVAVLTLCVLVTLAPAIGNVFEGILQGVGTP